MEDKELNDVLAQAFQNAPPYIQELIRSGKFEQFMTQLQTRMSLRIDIADKVSTEVLMTLLGMTEPGDLPNALRTQAGVPEELINPILEETNRAVFGPLRNSLQNPQPTAAPKPAAPAGPKWVQVNAPAASSAPASPLASTPIYTAPVAPTPSVSVLNREPMPPPSRAPVPENLPGTMPVQMPTPGVQEVSVRTMSSDMSAVKHGEEPVPHLMPMPQVSEPMIHEITPMPRPQTPAARPQQSVPQMPTSTPPLSVQPPRPAQAPAPASYTRPYIPSSPPRAAPPPPRIPGSNDPYREPVE